MQKDIDENNENEELIVINDEFKKSTTLVRAKYKTTDREEKVLNYALSFTDQFVYLNYKIDGKDSIVPAFTFNMRELYNDASLKTTHMLQEALEVQKGIKQREIGYVDEITKKFQYRTLVIGADYDNGKMTLYFNPMLAPLYKEIKKYTPLSRKLMINLSVFASRLYENIKSECYVTNKNHRVNIVMEDKKDTKKVRYDITYDLSELKILLGLVDISTKKIRMILEDTKPDYDKVLDIAPEQIYKDWYAFRKRILNPAVKEINNKADIYLSYEPRKYGRGGKVTGVTFSCWLGSIDKIGDIKFADGKDVKTSKESNFGEENMMFAFEIGAELNEYELETNDLFKLAKMLEYDKDRLKKLKEVANAYVKKGNKINGIGFFITAINEGWEVKEDATESIDINDKQESNIDTEISEIEPDPSEIEENRKKAAETVQESFIKQLNILNMLTPLGLDTSHMFKLLELANNDYQLLEKCIDKLKTQKNIEDVMGWLCSAIQNNGYEEAIPYKGKSKESYMERDINEYRDINKKLGIDWD